MDDFHRKKFVVTFFVVANIFVIFLCFFLSWNEMRIKKLDVSDIPEEVLENSVTFNIEEAKCETGKYDGNLLKIEGWSIIIGKTTNPITMHILLKNAETEMILKLPTSILTRTDVTEAINDGINYDNSGFKVELNYKKSNIKEAKYEILLLYQVGEEQYIIPLNKKIKVR